MVDEREEARDEKRESEKQGKTVEPASKKLSVNANGTEGEKAEGVSTSDDTSPNNGQDIKGRIANTDPPIFFRSKLRTQQMVSEAIANYKVGHIHFLDVSNPSTSLLNTDNKPTPNLLKAELMGAR